MFQEITAESIQETINEAPAAAKALAAVIQQAASEYVQPLKMFLDLIGLKGHIPAGWLVQPIMVLAQKEFGKISRDAWIQLYDDMETLDRILAEHPEIAENYQSPDEVFDGIVAGLDLEMPEF